MYIFVSLKFIVNESLNTTPYIQRVQVSHRKALEADIDSQGEITFDVLWDELANKSAEVASRIGHASIKYVNSC